MDWLYLVILYHYLFLVVFDIWMLLDKMTETKTTSGEDLRQFGLTSKIIMTENMLCLHPLGNTYVSLSAIDAY